ncbi:MAG: glutamate-5-semialdehyde dehydrogenase [Gammaproteobacteria bacterium]
MTQSTPSSHDAPHDIAALAHDFATLGQAARLASTTLALAETAQKNRALEAMATALANAQSDIVQANAIDVRQAETSGLSDALVDRLRLTPQRIQAMIDSLHQVATLPDPIGNITDLSYRPSGIQVGRMRVPLGVIGMIYESRPNVTSEAASLAIKSGNAIILRGGSEAHHSNQAIATCLRQGLREADLPEASVTVINNTSREMVRLLLQSPEWIDVVIPRGGKRLIERVTQEAKVPVIKHLDGNCHLFVDDSAPIDMAVALTVNAKTQRYGTCCTLESLLVHHNIAAEFLPALHHKLDAHDVEIRGCATTQTYLPAALPATETDWYTEYLAPILSIKVVADLHAAIAHINQYGSHHTDGIITSHYPNTTTFLRAVDSSSVMVNASTRFADGNEYGLGAEIGISTDKFHVRGPVGLEGLTSQKYVVLGHGHCRQ